MTNQTHYLLTPRLRAHFPWSLMLLASLCGSQSETAIAAHCSAGTCPCGTLGCWFTSCSTVTCSCGSVGCPNSSGKTCSYCTRSKKKPPCGSKKGCSGCGKPNCGGVHDPHCKQRCKKENPPECTTQVTCCKCDGPCCYWWDCYPNVGYCPSCCDDTCVKAGYYCGTPTQQCDCNHEPPQWLWYLRCCKGQGKFSLLETDRMCLRCKCGRDCASCNEAYRSDCPSGNRKACFCGAGCAC